MVAQISPIPTKQLNLSWGETSKVLSQESYSRLAQLSNKSLVSFADLGHPSGVPMFFINGLIGNRYSIALYHEMALERGIRLICLDRPGRGLSTPPKSLKNYDFISWTNSFNEMLLILKIDD